ncbi:hypothetical protein MIND_00799100 [Mycena indigotica]|uniref:Uncharacterized protein n=1 Tax=Mycena indigotica TaxID=2126181 RepID=A0A8H6SIL5_9AGAR|nr:uncharacterized protein MIND_00799100 [Mycena indigotica]KAF7298525.1 hypothetical protein MIND_00799100 [Mycena indigotica]
MHRHHRPRYSRKFKSEVTDFIELVLRSDPYKTAVFPKLYSAPPPLSQGPSIIFQNYEKVSISFFLEGLDFLRCASPTTTEIPSVGGCATRRRTSYCLGKCRRAIRTTVGYSFFPSYARAQARYIYIRLNRQPSTLTFAWIGPSFYQDLSTFSIPFELYDDL